ncbi:HEPN domain-containing protein [bacterium]|nr:HEPN domain-containing protein [bacterium]
MDIAKQIQYWQIGAEKELLAAKSLDRDKFYTQCLFHVHLALEKILKAHVCRKTLAIAPLLHNLNRLAETAQLELSDKYIDILADMNRYNLAGRYPDPVVDEVSGEECREKLAQSEEVLKWLTAALLEA